MAVEDKHMRKLKDMVKEEITYMFEQALDFAQVACPEPHFKPLRSKILRVGNNCIRNINRKLEDYYDVKYKAPAEDLIEITQAK
jgi:hypothetical protein